jgi:hypothetical protein
LTFGFLFARKAATQICSGKARCRKKYRARKIEPSNKNNKSLYFIGFELFLRRSRFLRKRVVKEPCDCFNLYRVKAFRGEKLFYI